MNRKRALILIIILFTGLFPLIPIAKASEATVSIQNSEDDVWMTESGNIFGYESSVRILEPEIGIRSFLRFEDVPLLKSSKINLATLYVYAGFDQGETISPGAQVTIYGIDEPDCAPFSYSGRVWSLERPYTSAYVNWNVSDWHYSTWKSVNVTSIVKEIINQYAWTQNNSIGFQILGATDSGYEYRTFEDIDHQHHGAYAYLFFQYDVPPGTPPGLPDTAEWVETYGELDIWTVPGEFLYLDLPYSWIEGTGAPYDLMFDYIGNGAPVLVSEDVSASLQRPLTRTSNETLYLTFTDSTGATNQIYVIRSFDNGETWVDSTLLSTVDGMDTRAQYQSSLAVDSNDVIHVVWSGKSPAQTNTEIWYTNFTDSWSDPFKISTHTTTKASSNPSIAVDSNDVLQVVFYGTSGAYPTLAQVWYVNRTTSWGHPLRISTDSFTLQSSSTIEVGSNNSLHVAWECQTDELWYVNYTTSWLTPINIATHDGMAGVDQLAPSIAIDSSENIHIVWGGYATGYYGGRKQIWCATENGTWQTPVRISDATGMDSTGLQSDPSIAVAHNDTLQVIWHGTATGYGDDVVWNTNYTTSWGDTVCIQPTGENKWPQLLWHMWPEVDLSSTNDTFYLVDENNTVIVTWNGDNETDIDDLKDWADDYVDPEGGDPLDPDPGTQGWDTEGPWTRFNMRVYFLFIGLGCVFGPVWAMAYKKFDSVGYAWCFLVIVLGVGLLWSITGI